MLQLHAERQSQTLRDQRDLVLDEGREEVVLALLRLEREREGAVEAVVDEAIAKAGAEGLAAQATILVWTSRSTVSRLKISPCSFRLSRR